MRATIKRGIVIAAWTLVMSPALAQAQTTGQPSAPQPRKTTYRGMEMGVDVTAGRQGESALSLGAASTRGSLSVRFTRMDAGTTEPCSVGLGYEWQFTRDRARITPVAGASLGRVFSCTDGGNPDARGVATVSGGVRIPIFAGQGTVGALRLTVFSQQQFGATAATDVTSKGVTLGFVIGRR